MIIEQKTCIYCGSDESLVREHVIPCSFFGYRSENSARQWIVTGCATCNKLAGSFVCFSIPEKAKYISKRYKEYFKKVLRTPFWSEEELNGLKHSLRMAVITGLEAKAVINQKLKYLKEVSEYDIDYLRPPWVERWMVEEKKRQKELIKKLKPNVQKTNKTRENQTFKDSR
jgi:hypothetical protein